MYQIRFVLSTAKPKPLETYDTLFYPFDWYVWGLVLAVLFTQIVALVIIEGVWRTWSGVKYSNSLFQSK